MNKNLWIIPLLLVIMGIVAAFTGAGQAYPVTESRATDCPGFDCSLPPTTIPAPEFPTLAVPAGLLVGMIYIIFLLKNKG